MNCFAPIIAPDAKILILGSFPSLVYLEKNEYYGHKQNAFWPIMASIFEFPISNYESKKELVLNNKLALWDVCYTCNRTNSEDSTIKNTVPNEIPTILKNYPIEKVIFNGKTAAKLYKQTINYYPEHIQFCTLISTSPAATIPFNKKLESWSKALF